MNGKKKKTPKQEPASELYRSQLDAVVAML